MNRILRLGLCVLGFLVSVGCGALGYRSLSGNVRPAPEDAQEKGMAVLDDGTVKHSIGRLEISFRPMTDEELDRQFPIAFKERTNPYTYGNWQPPGENRTPSRFTVFRLGVKNYEFPKMQVDPSMAEIVTSNGRKYTAFNLLELENYYTRYAIGYAGNTYKKFNAQMDILTQTFYQNLPIFSGQEKMGYIVFPPMHPDVEKFSVHLKKIVLRYDYQNEPIETVDLSFQFQRKVYKARASEIAKGDGQ